MLEPSPVWLPRLEQCPLCGRAGGPRKHGESLPCSQSMGAWGGMFSWWCLLFPLISAVQPLSLSFLKPNHKCPLRFHGKSRCKDLVGEEGDFYWQTSAISVCHACRLQLRGLCLSTWLSPVCVLPSALDRSPCSGEEDMGCCLLRPACPPGIALNLARKFWGEIRLLQPSKGSGGGSLSSSYPTAVIHQDFCLLIWMCRETTDQCAGFLLTQQSSSHYQSPPPQSPAPCCSGHPLLTVTPTCYSHQSSIFHGNSLRFSTCSNSNHDCTLLPTSSIPGVIRYTPSEVPTACFCWLPQVHKCKET